MLIWPLATSLALAAIVIIPWGLGCFSSNSAQQARLVGIAAPLASASIALNSSAMYAGQALGARLLPQITAAAEERALRHPYGQTSIQLGELGVDAVALGAATLPVADLLARGAAPGKPAVRLDAPA